ncbi:MAG: bifunctional biotin--[acetyl-CoA-carboxylase] ligase/biotin operon repressor BirA [Methylococcaceae bacterium]
MRLSSKQKTILNILANGDFHSGTELALALDSSRAAVWKHIESLSELGLGHVAVRGKGYKLTRPLELLSAEKITAQLNAPANTLLQTLELHDQLDSSNTYLLEQAKQGATSGTVCFTEHQSAGKGRRGRHWISPFGSNIYLSMLWQFSQGSSALAGLSLAMGVAVLNALHEHGEFLQTPLAIGLKWPNDIIGNGKKLGGILIEISGENDGLCTAVVGLGLNLAMPKIAGEHINQAWTDLSQLTGKKSLARNQLAATLLNHCLPVLASFEQVGLSAYLEQWRSYDALANQSATVFIGEQRIEGIVRGIDDNGLLRLQRSDGTIQSFASGELSFSA